MKQLKNIAKIIARLMALVSGEQFRQDGEEFGQNIVENAQIIEKVVNEIRDELKAIGIGSREAYNGTADRLSQLRAILSEVVLAINSQESKNFVENIAENVKIALDLSAQVLKLFGVDTEFRSRGVNSALGQEIEAELLQELEG